MEKINYNFTGINGDKKTAKIVIVNGDKLTDLYLSDLTNKIGDTIAPGTESDHLVMQKDSSNGSVWINGKEVNQAVVREIIAFLS